LQAARTKVYQWLMFLLMLSHCVISLQEPAQQHRQQLTAAKWRCWQQQAILNIALWSKADLGLGNSSSHCIGFNARRSIWTCRQQQQWQRHSSPTTSSGKLTNLCTGAAGAAATAGAATAGAAAAEGAAAAAAVRPTTA
jgi:hypothetical protein